MQVLDCRYLEISISIIDEASQITEAYAIIAWVNGCRKAILFRDQ